MEAKEDLLTESLRSFSLLSLSRPGAPLEPENWREVMKENVATFHRFLSSEDCSQLFLFRREDSSLAASLNFPPGCCSKVICASKSSPAESSRSPLEILEVPGGQVREYISTLTEQVACSLLSNPKLDVGLTSEALSSMVVLKKEALVMKAQVEGQIFLPLPASLSEDSHHDDGLLDDRGEHGQVDFKLLHACEGTIIEWAQSVSEFLQQDWSELVLEVLKPLPSEEFNFWNNRLKTLAFIQQQLTNPEAHQLASIVQMADSVYWPILQGVYRDVQKGLQEAEAETVNLSSFQEIEETMQQLDYQQLEENLAAVMKEVGLLWARSELHHQPRRMVVLLQEICNLIIDLSRRFLRGEELLCGIVLEPEVVLKNVTMVMETLRTLKRVYAEQCSLLQQQNRQDSLCWDFPKHMIFSQLDHLLTRLHSIREVLFVREQMYQLAQTVLSGVQGGMWMDVLHQVFVDFVAHLRVLSDCGCDPTDTEDQSLKVHLDQFQAQVSDLELQLVSILSQNLQDCRESSSAAKLVKMFGFILDRPAIRQQLRPQFSQVVKIVLQELDQTKQLFYSQREQLQIFSQFSPTILARLSWTQQLCRRAEDALRNFQTVQHLCVASDESQLVLHRFQQVVKLLEEHREELKSAWRSGLEADSDFLSKQPLVFHSQQGELEVSCSHKLEELLRELRSAGMERNMELSPHAKRLHTCRDDVSQSLRSLSFAVSCYNQVLRGLLPVERPLVQDRLQDLSKTLSQLQRDTWNSADVHQQVQQFSQWVLLLHSSWTEARAGLEELTVILQGWADLQLLQHSSDSLLEEGVTEQSRRIQKEWEELLRLTQVIGGAYGSERSSQAWISYLDHIDDRVQDSLFTMLSRALNYLSDCTHPQRCSGALLGVSLLLQESDGVFKSILDSSPFERLQSIMSDLYTASSLPSRVSVSRDGNYQEFLWQNAELSSLEQEVLHHVEDVSVEVEHLRSGLDRFSNLWQSDKTKIFQEFLTYSRQLGAEEVEPQPTPPTLKDFQREMESLSSLSSELSLMEEVQLLQGWLLVDLGPFRDSLLSVIYSWKDMYTTFLLNSLTASLLQVTQPTVQDEESSSSSSFPLTQTILLLESAGVQLPQHLAAQLQLK